MKFEFDYPLIVQLQNEYWIEKVNQEEKRDINWLSDKSFAKTKDTLEHVTKKLPQMFLNSL